MLRRYPRQPLRSMHWLLATWGRPRTHLFVHDLTTRVENGPNNNNNNKKKTPKYLWQQHWEQVVHSLLTDVVCDFCYVVRSATATNGFNNQKTHLVYWTGGISIRICSSGCSRMIFALPTACTHTGMNRQQAKQTIVFTFHVFFVFSNQRISALGSHNFKRKTLTIEILKRQTIFF